MFFKIDNVKYSDNDEYRKGIVLGVLYFIMLYKKNRGSIFYKKEKNIFDFYCYFKI